MNDFLSIQREIEDVNELLLNKYSDLFKMDNETFKKEILTKVGKINKLKKLSKEEYHKYQAVLEVDSWGEPIVEDLDLGKQYFCIKPDKNRAGSKDKIMLFEIDLNLNIWRNIGYIIKKPKNSD